VAIASAGLTRAAHLPKVPTVIESGLKDYEVTSWNGMSAPAGTAPAIIDSLNQAVEDCHCQSGHPEQGGENGHDHALERA